MPLYDLKVPYGSTPEQWLRKLKPQLPRSLYPGYPKGYALHIHRRSLDARRKPALTWQLRVEVLKTGESPARAPSRLPKRLDSQSAQPAQTDAEAAFPESEEAARPMVVGAGPAGLFCALYLARAGFKPYIVEQGEAVEHRLPRVEAFWENGTLSPYSNVQYGEGGAGTFSDGKLHTGKKSPWIDSFFQALVEHGAPESILWEAQPHVGTDRLPEILQSLRQELIQSGSTFLFATQWQGVKQTAAGLTSVLYDWQADRRLEIPVSAVFLGIGHSARETYPVLAEMGVALEAKAMAVGVRIEHRQAYLNAVQYGQAACARWADLPPTAYKLIDHPQTGRACYSFCMCPGGEVIAAASGPRQVVTNGMSRYARNEPHGNSALLVAVTPQDYAAFLQSQPPEHPDLARFAQLAQQHPALAGLYFQATLEYRAYCLGGQTGQAPVMSVRAFLAPQPMTVDPTPESGSDRVQTDGSGSETAASLQAFAPDQTDWTLLAPSYQLGVRECDFRSLFPAEIVSTLQEALPHFGQKMKGFDQVPARLYAVESRSSAPVRILRDAQTRQAKCQNWLYPIGEGAGYAGGITSSAIDGMKSAEAWLARQKERAEITHEG